MNSTKKDGTGEFSPLCADVWDVRALIHLVKQKLSVY